MHGRFYKILEKGFYIFFYVILIGLFLKGEVFRVHTKWVCLTFTSVKNFIPVFIVWWAILKIRRKPKLSFWLIPILILGIISILLSRYFTESLKAGMVLIVYIFWFYSLRDVFKKEELVINTAVLMIFLAGLINILNLFFHYSIGFGEILERYPFWQGKNALGLFLVMALCIAGNLTYKSKWKLLGAINSILLILGVIFSYSRGAWISGLVAVVGLALYRFKRALWIIIICVIIFFTISPSLVSERFSSMFGRDDVNIKQRLEVWRHCVDMVKKKPIIGTGLGTFTEAYRSNFPGTVPLGGEGSRIIRHAHNLYLQILVETGVLGLALFIFLVIAGFICSIRNFIKEEDQALKSIRYGCLLGIFAFLIYSITDCTMSWKFMGDSFLHINLIWILLWAIILKPHDYTRLAHD